MTPATNGAPAIRPIGADAIFVDGLVRLIAVGILPEEQGITQRVRFSVRLTLSPDACADGDEPAVSYMDIVEVIDDVSAAHTPLLEQLAERVAERLLANRLVTDAAIAIEKLDILTGEGTVGIHIVRERAA